MTKSKKYYFMYLNAIASSFAVVVAHTITNPAQLGIQASRPRSEERRVGKECAA